MCGDKDSQRSKQMEITGIPSGFNDLDKLSYGFHPGEFIIIAVRPGLGKTALALSMAANISIRQSKPVAFFSLELSFQCLTTRLISAESGVEVNKLLTGLFPSSYIENKILPAGKVIEDAPLYFADNAFMTIIDIQALARRLRIEEKIEIIFIDYIGLIAPDNEQLSRWEHISEVIRSLKELAQELNIPVVGFFQLGREDEDKESIFVDKKYAGLIEKYVDKIMFVVHKQELDESMEDQAKESSKRVHLILTKNREEILGTADLIYLNQLFKFVNEGISSYDEESDDD